MVLIIGHRLDEADETEFDLEDDFPSLPELPNVKKFLACTSAIHVLPHLSFDVMHSHLKPLAASSCHLSSLHATGLLMR